MYALRKDLGIGVVTPEAGGPEGILAKCRVAELLGIEVNILAQRVRLWVTPGRGCFTVERVKSEMVRPAHHPEKSRRTNLKFECSNAQNNQENIHFITVNLF